MYQVTNIIERNHEERQLYIHGKYSNLTSPLIFKSWYSLYYLLEKYVVRKRD